PHTLPPFWDAPSDSPRKPTDKAPLDQCDAYCLYGNGKRTGLGLLARAGRVGSPSGASTPHEGHQPGEDVDPAHDAEGARTGRPLPEPVAPVRANVRP